MSMRGLAIAFMAFFILPLVFVLGALYGNNGDSVPRECVQVSHSVSEKLGVGDDAGWVYDSRTVYTGDCGLAMLRGGE